MFYEPLSGRFSGPVGSCIGAQRAPGAAEPPGRSPGEARASIMERSDLFYFLERSDFFKFFFTIWSKLAKKKCVSGNTHFAQKKFVFSGKKLLYL